MIKLGYDNVNEKVGLVESKSSSTKTTKNGTPVVDAIEEIRYYLDSSNGSGISFNKKSDDIINAFKECGYTASRTWISPYKDAILLDKSGKEVNLKDIPDKYIIYVYDKIGFRYRNSEEEKRDREEWAKNYTYSGSKKQR